MTTELIKLMSMMGTNAVYAIICIAIGLTAMVVGYKVFDWITPYDTGKELKEGNIAVAIVVGCITLGVAVCSGTIIGLACN